MYIVLITVEAEFLNGLMEVTETKNFAEDQKLLWPPHRAMVAFQDSSQVNGAGGRNRFSATGGAAYGIPRNQLTLLHSAPMRIARDLPINTPWDGMFTEVTPGSEIGRNKSI